MKRFHRVHIRAAYRTDRDNYDNTIITLSDCIRRDCIVHPLHSYVGDIKFTVCNRVSVTLFES